MSIVAVHGPYTFGSNAITQNSTGSAYATTVDGLIWTFQAKDQSQVNANYDWAYTGAAGTPASPIADTKAPVVTLPAGAHTVTLTLNGVAQPTFVINAQAAGAGFSPLSVEEGDDKNTRARADTKTTDTALERNTAALKENTQAVEENTEAQLEFDPADFTVGEIEDYVRQNPSEAPAVLEAERAGKGRVTLMTFLESFSDDE